MVSDMNTHEQTVEEWEKRFDEFIKEACDSGDEKFIAPGYWFHDELKHFIGSIVESEKLALLRGLEKQREIDDEKYYLEGFKDASNQIRRQLKQRYASEKLALLRGLRMKKVDIMERMKEDRRLDDYDYNQGIGYNQAADELNTRLDAEIKKLQGKK